MEWQTPEEEEAELNAKIIAEGYTLIDEQEPPQDVALLARSEKAIYEAIYKGNNIWRYFYKKIEGRELDEDALIGWKVPDTAKPDGEGEA